MGFADAVKSLYKNYFKFEGRALRSEYWWAYLYLIILYVAMLVVTGLLGQAVGGIVALVIGLVILASLVPFIALTVRRLHDVDKSGWFFLLSFVPIVSFYILYLTIIKGTDGPNTFGADPLGHSADIFN